MGNTTSSKLQLALKSPDTFSLSPKTRYYGFENVFPLVFSLVRVARSVSPNFLLRFVVWQHLLL